MSLLLAQPEHVTDTWRPVAEAINQWLWRWSPWHLRHLNMELADQATRWRRQLREAEAEIVTLAHRNQQLKAYIAREPDYPRLTSPVGSVDIHEEVFSQVHTLRISSKAFCFSILGIKDFLHACRTDDVVEMMAEDYALRFCRDLKHRIADELRAFAKC